MELRLSDRGAGVAFSVWLFFAVLSAFLIIMALYFALAAVVTTPSPCEAGTLGGLGLAAAFFGGAMLSGLPARRGLPAAAASKRRPGSVRIDDDALIVDVPGLLREPQRIDRSWVAEVVETASELSTGGVARMTLSVRASAAGVALSIPIGLPTATATPQLPRVPLPSPPAPWDEVSALAFAFEDQTSALAALRSWIATPTSAPAVAPPPPTASGRRRGLWETIIPIAVMAAGVAVLWIEVPSGPQCP